LYPDRTAVRSERFELTYGELDRAVRRAGATLLRTTGGTSGRACIYRAGDLDALVWLFASLRNGGSVVFPGDREPVEAIRSLASRDLFDVLISGAGHDGLSVSGVSFLESGDLFGSASGASLSPDRKALLNLDAPATWIRTSGSTGHPRFVVHSMRAHLFSARASNARIPLQAGDAWLLSLPVFHVGGLAIAFRAFLAGAAIAIPEGRGIPAAAVRSLRPTHVSLVATQLKRMLDAIPTAPPHLTCVLVGGGPVDAPVIRRAVAGGYPVRTTYGMTEYASQVTTSSVWREEREAYSSGRPLEGMEVRVASDGEILIRAASAFEGYAVGSSVASPALSDGWFATGDLGAWVEGELHVRGRRDTMFISGGENIQPEEIERALRQIEEIEDAVVVDIPDAEFGFRPVAYVRRRAPITAEKHTFAGGRRSLRRRCARD
jgi:O-succinylbenzoic acid--CoA ligase